MTVTELYNQQLEASGAEKLLEALPSQTRELLEALGIDTLQPLVFPDTETTLQQLLSLLAEAFKEPLAVAVTVLAVTLLYAWINGLRETWSSSDTVSVFSSVCALSVCGVVMLPLTRCITAVNEAVESAGIFMASFTPVYAAVLLGGGQAVSALSFQSVVLYASQLMTWLAGGVIVPLMTVSLALGVTGSVTPQLRLGGVGKWIGSVSVKVLMFGMMLFTGILSLQSLTGNAADNLGARALRFSVVNFVPVVGGSLGEMFSTVRGCLQLLRSTVGGFGVAATVLMIAPPLFRCLAFGLLLSLCRMATDLFELKTLTGIVDAARSAIKSLTGVLCACSSFLIIAITVVTAATGG